MAGDAMKPDEALKQNEALRSDIAAVIRAVPNFPQPGILFRDITPLLQTPDLMSRVVTWFADFARAQAAHKIVAVESRGFLFGAAICERLGLPLVLARKAGKLPHQTISRSYALEYGEATLQIHVDSLRAGDRVVIVDDVLATGGTAAAVKSLVGDLGAETVGFQFLMELTALRGRALIDGLDVHVEALIAYH